MLFRSCTSYHNFGAFPELRYCRLGFTSWCFFSSPFFQNCVTVRAVDTVNTARAVDTVAIANTVGTVDIVGTLDTVVFLRKSYRLSGVCVYWITVFCSIHLFCFFAIEKCAFFFCC